jgi:hypothetical protein
VGGREKLFTLFRSLHGHIQSIRCDLLSMSSLAIYAEAASMERLEISQRVGLEPEAGLQEICAAATWRLHRPTTAIGAGLL